ncbi:SDR family NAD(P)-dependent oxidoreductase [Psychromarinibacter sp. S121]|uniref:SDR family NAD(P)-dependent oxidoreductase n=1 Tax=Psychromarinibacter sp. S121 TaxID=3415127 RepID=UPI003C7C9CD3
MARALVIGSSGGIGGALLSGAEARGFEVTGLSRSGDGLDITDPGSVDLHLGALEGTFDLIVVATGALQSGGRAPEKALKQIDAAYLAAQFAVNALGPALILKHAPRLMPKETPATLGVLSARVGSIGDNGLGGWYGYRAAKAAANQIVHTAAIELARTHKQAVCVALHPGTVATPFTADFVSPEKATPPAEAAGNLLDVLTGLSASQTGGFYDYAGKEIPW